MLKSDIKDYNIKNFTWAEIKATGADPKDVNIFGMVALQKFRVHPYVNRSVVFLPNGITTGGHSSFQHPNGTAYDISFRDFEKPDPLVPKHLVYAAEECGFKGIGLYYNGAAFSMHLDLGPEIRRWLWMKQHRKDKFKKFDLIVDPYELYKREFDK